MTDTPAQPVDLVDPDSFADGIPYGYFDHLRSDDPVHWHPHPDHDGFWAITRAADVEAISRDTTRFSNYEKGVFLEADTVLPLDFIRQSLLLMDPPQHTRLRRTISRRFTPKTVTNLEPRVRQITNEVIDQVIEQGTCDFSADIAVQLPLAMICELMGVPEADRMQVFEWANKISSFDDPSVRADVDDGLIAFEESYIYVIELAEEKLENPGDDLISLLAQPDTGGDEPLSEIEIANFFQLLSVAGNETTRHTTCHGLQALIDHPDQRRQLRDDPSLVPNAVEEILRWGSVVNYFRRTPMEDVELHGTRMKAGDPVALYYVAANRDPEAFPDPDTFNIQRDFKGNQFAFGGGGPHFCLGATLARMQLRVMFETLVERLPDATNAGPITRLRSNWMHGIEAMPIEFTPGAPSAP